MMKFSLIEVFFRGIPEGLLFIMAIHLFTRNSIKLKRYLLSSLLFSAIIFFIRALPIEMGVNTMLNIIAVALLNVLINKIETVKAIRATIAVIILGFISEAFNVIIIKQVLKADLNYIFSKPELKVLYGIPSLVIFGVFICVYCLVAVKRRELVKE